MYCPFFEEIIMSKDISKDLAEAIDVLAKQIANSLKYSNSNYDRTFISVVKAINSNGTYTVIDDFGNERICVLALPNVTLSVGQRVYATIPQGDLTKMYISGIHPQINNR